MAAVTGTKACSATLTSTTADTVTLTGHGKRLYVSNRDATNHLFFRIDGTTAVAAEDENFAVSPDSTLVLEEGGFGGAMSVSVVGDGNAYTVAVF